MSSPLAAPFIIVSNCNKLGEERDIPPVVDKLVGMVVVRVAVLEVVAPVV